MQVVHQKGMQFGSGRVFQYGISACKYAWLSFTLTPSAPRVEVMPMAARLSLDALKAAYYRVHDPGLTQDQIASKAGLGTQA